MDSHSHDPQPAFHAGERAMQQTVGMAERMAHIGEQVIRDYLPLQHRQFFAQLPFVVVGSVDGAGQPAASILAAPPGFASAPDGHTLHIGVLPQAADPLAANLRVGASVGVLGIEPHTRRRNRANGIISAMSAQGMSLSVRQSFGNCPKYIQAREPAYDATRIPGAARVMDALDPRATRLVERADTFFIASAHPAAAQGSPRSHGVDISHRGGKPGFVRIDGDVLSVPDFRGNFFFNTLGNLVVNPLAGLLFVDFDSGDLLHIDVDATVIARSAELASAGVERQLQMRVKKAWWRPTALPLRWGEVTYSPSLEGSGAWSVG